MSKTAQDIQDSIFKKMTADQKVEVGIRLWFLGKALMDARNTHGTVRPEKIADRGRRHPR